MCQAIAVMRPSRPAWNFQSMAVGRNSEPLCDNTEPAPENCLIELPDSGRSRTSALGQEPSETGNPNHCALTGDCRPKTAGHSAIAIFLKAAIDPAYGKPKEFSE